MSEWSHLPNKVGIDRVINSLCNDLAKWNAARDAAWGAAWDAAWDAARDAAWDAARDAAQGAAWDAARGAARGAAWDAAWGAAWSAIAALIAWDEAGDMLDLPLDAVRLLAHCGNHAAVLLLPACVVFNGAKND